VTAAGSDAQEEGAQRSWCFRRSPRGLDQHCPGVRAVSDVSRPPIPI
jgi:hypothetical protein